MKKVSIIVTTFNEEATVGKLLRALLEQTYQPDEVIICDGGSRDQTWNLLQDIKKKNLKFRLHLYKDVGNISHGRNVAISYAKNNLLAITDAGCIPEKDWLEELVAEYERSGRCVIAGYYKGLPTTLFEEAVVPYVLVMSDKIDENNFLPATRSMLMEKKLWEKYSGFDERLAVSEDYAFAKKLQHDQVPIAFAKKAIVGWMPRKNIFSFFLMVSRFAQYDVIAEIIRFKVIFIFARYIAVIFLLLSTLIIKSQLLLFLIMILFALYCLWAVKKNLKYVTHGWMWLPVLQLTADVAVILGTLKGVFTRR